MSESSPSHKDPAVEDIVAEAATKSDDDDEGSTYATAEGAEFPKLDEAFLAPRRDVKADIVAKYDKITQDGMHAFFANDFAKADELFKNNFKDDPLVANARGTLGTIKALLSFEGPDIEMASNRLLFSAGFGNGVQPPSQGMLKAMTGWLTRTQQSDRLTPAQYRALVVVGEAEMLRANVLLVQDTFSGYIKAGLALRRGYNIFDRLYKYLLKYPNDHGVDANSVGGVHFGIGTIHVSTSILPPKVLAILKALGYMHDRAVGFEHLQKCLDSNTLRSPMASLFMLAFYGVLPSFAPLTGPKNIPLADEVLKKTLAQFPESVIHLWLHGRVERLKRRIPDSIAIFRRTIANAGESLAEALPQLQHFALYDLAWSYTGQCDWQRGARCLRTLEENNSWSKMAYAYSQGTCFDMMAMDCVVPSAASPAEDYAPKETLWEPLPDFTSPEYKDILQAAKRLIKETMVVPARKKSSSSDVPEDDLSTSELNTNEKLKDDIRMRVLVLREAARRCYQRAVHYSSIKLGGKTISVEQYVRKRLKDRYGFVRREIENVKYQEISRDPLANNNKIITSDDFDNKEAEVSAADGGEDEAESASPLTAPPIDSKTMPGGFFEKDAAATDHSNWRRYATIQDQHILRRLSGVEIALHFNVMTQCGLKTLRRYKEYVDFVMDEILANAGDASIKLGNTLPEDRHVVTILQAALQKELGNPAAADTLYQSLIEESAKTFTQETWVQPYALYDRGILLYNYRTLKTEGEATTTKDKTKDAQDPDIPRYEEDDSHRDESKQILTSQFKSKFGGKDYSFEMTMQFRLHLTQDMFAPPGKH